MRRGHEEAAAESGASAAAPTSGRHLVLDTTGDGQLDTILRDTDNDGRLNHSVAISSLVDTTGDGRADTALGDSNGDGRLDAVAAVHHGSIARVAGLPYSLTKVAPARRKTRPGTRQTLHSGKYKPTDLETDQMDGSDWVRENKDGGKYSAGCISPKKPTWRSTMSYYYNGVFKNQLNKFQYMHYRGELGAVSKTVDSLSEQLHELSSHRELHDSQMQDKEGQELDDAVERVDPGFTRRMVEDIALAFKDIDDIIRDESLGRLGSTHRLLCMKVVKVNDVNDVFFFANAPVEYFVETYISRRSQFLSSVRVASFGSDDNCGPGTDDTGALSRQKSNHSSYLRMYNSALERAWDSDQDGAHFDFIEARLSDLSSTLAELETMGDFVKLSVDSNDQLRFKALLMVINILIFLSQFFWDLVKGKRSSGAGVDGDMSFIECSDGALLYCPVCTAPADFATP
eukprot:COSAG05_NODE_2517_length_2951_cov_25.983871_1_plen_457_part_00